MDFAEDSAPASIASFMKCRADNVDPKNARLEFRRNKDKLKSDLKKATAFGKKLRTFTADQEKSVLSDLQTVNVTMFVSEAAKSVGPAVWDGKMKGTDIAPLVACISAIHQRYDDFLKDALQGIQEGFNIKPLLDECAAKLDPLAPIADSARLRLATRLMGELWLNGLVPSCRFFISILAKFTALLDAPAVEGAVAPHVTVNLLQLVITILRTCGLELTSPAFPGPAAMQLIFLEAVTGGPTNVEEVKESAAAEMESRLAERRQPAYYDAAMASEQERAEFTKRVIRIADSALDLCEKFKKSVEGGWKRLCERTELAGNAANEQRAQFSALKKEAERFIVLTENIAAMIGHERRPSRIDLEVALRGSAVDQTVILMSSGLSEFFTVRNAEAINYYDNDALRAFYEVLPEASDIISADIVAAELLATIAAAPAAAKPSKKAADDWEDYDEEEAAPSDSEPAIAVTMRSGERIQASFDAVQQHLAQLLEVCTDEAQADQWGRTYFELACAYFPTATPQHAQQYFAVCRRLLHRALRYLGRCPQELIPCIARAVAVLSKVVPDVGDLIGQQLEGELQHAIRAKSQVAYLRKMRAARYLCELTKFRIAAPLRVIRVFQNCLAEAENEHCVEIILILISQVTSFLLRGGVTKARAEECLKQLADIRTNKAFITKAHDALLDHALAELNESMTAPTSRPRELQIRPRSLLEQYVRHLLFSKLTAETTDVVIKKMLAMPWFRGALADLPLDDPKATVGGETHYDMLLRVLRKSHQCRWDRLHLLAEVLAKVSQQCRSVGVAVTASVLEDIRTDLTVAAVAHYSALEKCAASEGGKAIPEEGPAQGKPASSLARHLAKSQEATRETSGLFSGAGARSQQKIIIDLKYLGELYNFKQVSFKLVSYVLAQIIIFYPMDPKGAAQRPLSAAQRARLSTGYGPGADLHNFFVRNTVPVDYSRVRFACCFVDAVLPYFPSNPSDGFKLVLERFLARFFLLIHSKAKPLPIDLDYKLADTLKRMSDYLYPVPRECQHLLQDGASSAVTSLEEVPEAEMELFENELRRAVAAELKRKYTTAKWRQEPSSKRRLLKRKAEKDVLLSGGVQYNVGPKKINPRVIARLMLKDMNEELVVGDEREVGEEVVRPAFFPASRKDAEQNLDYFVSGRQDKHPAASALSAPLPDSAKQSRSQRRRAQDIRRLALSAIPTPTAPEFCSEVAWFESICESLSAAATNGGTIYPVINSDAQQQVLDTTDMEVGGCRAVPVEGRDDARYASSSPSATAVSVEEAAEEDEFDTDSESSTGSDSESESSSSDSGSSAEESSEDEERGPTFGAEAFGLTMGRKEARRDGRDEASGDTSDDAEVERLLQRMILESTAKGVGSERGAVMDKKLDQRLSASAVHTAVEKMRSHKPAGQAGAVQAGAEGTAGSEPAPDAANSQPMRQFALMRRSNRGTADAKPFYVPSASAFAAHVENNITEGENERKSNAAATRRLIRQQALEESDPQADNGLDGGSARSVRQRPSASTAKKPQQNVKEDRIGSYRFAQ